MIQSPEDALVWRTKARTLRARAQSSDDPMIVRLLRQTADEIDGEAEVIEGFRSHPPKAG
jgi:hypothetical protein